MNLQDIGGPQKEIYMLDTACLVTPLPPEFNYLYEAYHMHCKESGSDKFWSLYAVTDIASAMSSRQLPIGYPGYTSNLDPIGSIRVILRWGKVGLLGQTSVIEFENKWQAKQYIESRIKDKVKKSYVPLAAAAAFALRPVKNQVPATRVVAAKISAKQTFAWDL